MLGEHESESEQRQATASENQADRQAAARAVGAEQLAEHGSNAHEHYDDDDIGITVEHS